LIVKVPLRPMMLEEVPSPKVTEAIEVLALKAEPPIVVTEFGMVREESLSLAKQLPPIVVTAGPKVTLARLVQLMNALPFKVVIREPVATLVKALQPLKQSAPKDVK
jgi:NAD(P)H-dependent flavin oxidoreductase YrpB (nitropropane dioxygenase family)